MSKLYEDIGGSSPARTLYLTSCRSRSQRTHMGKYSLPPGATSGVLALVAIPFVPSSFLLLVVMPFVTIAMPLLLVEGSPPTRPATSTLSRCQEVSQGPDVAWSRFWILFGIRFWYIFFYCRFTYNLQYPTTAWKGLNVSGECPQVVFFGY